MKKQNTHLGPLIKQALREREWSQTHLAKLSGISVVQINRIINGHVGPSDETVQKIRDAFGGLLAEPTIEPGTDFGSRLTEARRRKKISQDEFADELGVHPATVSNWEIGKTTPNAFILTCICELLGVSADWLLGLSEE